MMTPARRRHWARVNSLARIIGARSESISAGYHDELRLPVAERALIDDVRRLAEALGIITNTDETKG